MKREPIQPRIVRRVALMSPFLAAAVAALIFLIVHEIAYHLTAGDDFPLVVDVNGATVLAVSHGGLDSLGVAILLLFVLWAIERARIHERRPR